MKASYPPHPGPRLQRGRNLKSLALTLVAAALAIALGAIAGTPVAAADLPDHYISTGSTLWTYSEDDTDPAAGQSDRLVWTQAGFDDSDWLQAAGAFGTKNGGTGTIGASFPINTTLRHYANGSGFPAVRTYHFRTTIEITADELEEIDRLIGEVVHDDALQVFVNGIKVAGFLDDRVESAPEAERNLVYAGTSRADPVTSTLTVPGDVLVEGENTIAVALYQDRDTSSDIYLDLRELAPVGIPDSATYRSLVLTIGEDESKRNIAWYADVDQPMAVQYAPGTTDDPFPVADATTFPATGGGTTSGEFNRFATMDGLSENTTYTYRVGSDAMGWTEPEQFRTGSFSGDYGFLFFGDPQIGASGNVANDQAGWTDTLNVAMEAFPDSELLFSAGDQVEHAGSEPQYNALLAPAQMRQVPFVPVNGNHDVGSKAYEQHYNVPNLDPDAGAALSGTSSGGDYWFTYKDVLYMVINSNNPDTSSHSQFLEDVVAEHGADAKWKVLAFHHSIYSVAAHVNDSDIIHRRASLPELISELGIDLVLMGHDHSYTRSYLVRNGELANQEETPAQSEVVAGEGEVLYVTANSASGSKYYNVLAPNAWYASVINQEHVRNYTNVEVGDRSITMTTYRSQMGGSGLPVNSVVDEVTLSRPALPEPPETPPVAIGKAQLQLKAGSRKLSARIGKSKKVTLRVANRGKATSKPVKVCAVAPKKRVRTAGKKCKRLAPVRAGGTRKVSFKFKLKKGAGKNTKVKFRLTSGGHPNRQANVRVRARNN